MKEDLKLLIIRGAPGSGKSSLGRRLKKVFANGVLVEVDNVRGMMNKVSWVEEQEHLHALEATAALVKVYSDAGFAPVIVVDMFMPDKLDFFLQKFPGTSYRIISLVCEDAVLRERLTVRKEGFKDLEKGMVLNESIRQNRAGQELVLETALMDKNEIAAACLEFIRTTTAGINN